MSRSVTFKGDPKTLVGDQVEVGQPAPDFELTNGSMETVTVQDLKGKPTLISVVPSLDTPVCQTQTKRFNEEIAALGDQVHAVMAGPRDGRAVDQDFAGFGKIKARDQVHQR